MGDCSNLIVEGFALLENRACDNANSCPDSCENQSLLDCSGLIVEGFALLEGRPCNAEKHYSLNDFAKLKLDRGSMEAVLNQRPGWDFFLDGEGGVEDDASSTQYGYASSMSTSHGSSFCCA